MNNLPELSGRLAGRGANVYVWGVATVHNNK